MTPAAIRVVVILRAWFCALVLAIPAATWADPWDGAYDWSQVADLYPGIKFTEVTNTGVPRRMVVQVLRVDTANPDIRFTTGGRHSDWGQPMPEFPQYTIRTGRQTTRAFLQGYRAGGTNMVAAINASPWNPWSVLSTVQKLSYPYADQLGLTVSEGMQVDEGRNTPSFIVFKDGTVGMRNTPSDTDISRMATVVSGFQFVLQNGNVTGRAASTPDPRTGYGLCPRNRYAIFMTIDGRQAGYSEGARDQEVGQWLKYFGAHIGINMDGGGSTTMFTVNPANGSLVRRNRPSTGFSLMAIERPNGGNLGIYYISAAKSAVPDD